MSYFTAKYLELRKESLEYIREFFKKDNITRYEFVSPDEIESDDFTDNHWQYPQATVVGRHEHTYYYTITSITLEDGNLWFNGVSIGEDSDDYNFGETEVDVACLCDSADLLTSNNK